MFKFKIWIIGLVSLLFVRCERSNNDTIPKCNDPIVNAGNDQVNILGYSTQLNASVPKENEKSRWTIISGNNGILSDYSEPNAKFTGAYGEIYTLVWNTSNDCGNTASDTVEISFVCPVISASAGADQLNITAASTNLAATAPKASENGRWSIIAGTGGEISDSSLYKSSFTGVLKTMYILTWTVNNICGETAIDTVKLRFIPLFDYGEVKDVDGNVYNTIKIGTQTWMAENLKTTKYNDRGSILNITNNSAWSASSGAYCYYNNDISYKTKTGALYNFHTVVTGKLCPINWHIPSEDEWFTLAKYADPNAVRDFLVSPKGAKLTSTKENGTDNYGFSAVIGEYRNSSGSFDANWRSARWWSTDIVPGRGAGHFMIQDGETMMMSESPMDYGLSVRCLKD